MKQTPIPFSIVRTLLASVAVLVALTMVVAVDANAAPSGKFQYTDTWAGQPSGQFSNPYDTEVAPNGDVFVLDANNHRVQVFDGNGVYKYQFGKFGGAAGQLRSPLGMEIDDNRIFIADSGNNRVQLFTLGGEYLGQFGSAGSGSGQFTAPRDVTIAPGRGYVYVADSGNNRIQVWNQTGPSTFSFVYSFGTGGSGTLQFNIPFGVDAAQQWDPLCNDDDGGWVSRIYIADTLNDRVQRYTMPCDSVVVSYSGTWSAPTWPVKVEVVDENALASDVYVARTVSNQITRFGPTGTVIASWGTSGTADGQMRQPGGVSINAATNQVYVADSINNRIQRFSSTGTYQTKWGISQTGDGEFSAPHDVARDGAGNIYVTDRNNDRVQKFSSSGRFLLQWGGTGSGNGQFNSPRGIYVSSTNEVYVADTLNNRIQVFDSSGNYVNKWGTFGTGNGQFSGPSDLTMIGTAIYVVDGANNRVQAFSAPGTYVTQWGSTGNANGQFSFAKSIATAGGYLFVTDSTRVQQFNFGGGFINSTAVSGGPAGVAWSNNVLALTLADNGQLRYYRASPGGTPYEPKTYCTNGSGPGQTSGAQGLALDFTEWDAGTDDYTSTVFTADTGNNRVTRNWIESGSCNPQGALGNTEMSRPSYSAIAPNGDVYVSDSDSQRIVRYDSAGNVLARWGLGVGPDGFNGGTRGVAVGSDSTVYVADSSTVRRFSATGAPLNVVNTGGNTSQDIVIGNSNQVYRVGNNNVSIYGQDLTYQSQFGTLGTGNGQFTAAMGLGILPGGDVMVADSGNNRIQRFTPAGVYVSQFATPSPRDVARGPDGRIYVTGLDNTVRVYATYGGPLVDQWGSTGSNAGQFAEPRGIAISSSNRVFVNDVNNNRLQLFDWLPSRVQYSSEATDYAGNQVNVPNLETTTVEGGF